MPSPVVPCAHNGVRETHLHQRLRDWLDDGPDPGPDDGPDEAGTAVMQPWGRRLGLVVSPGILQPWLSRQVAQCPWGSWQDLSPPAMQGDIR